MILGGTTYSAMNGPGGPFWGEPGIHVLTVITLEGAAGSLASLGEAIECYTLFPPT